MAKRKTALLVEIIQGKTTVAEANGAYDLSPSKIGGSVEDAPLGMDFKGTVAPDGAAYTLKMALWVNPLEFRKQSRNS